MKTIRDLTNLKIDKINLSFVIDRKIKIRLHFQHTLSTNIKNLDKQFNICYKILGLGRPTEKKSYPLPAQLAYG